MPGEKTAIKVKVTPDGGGLPSLAKPDNHTSALPSLLNKKKGGYAKVGIKFEIFAISDLLK